CGQWTAAEGKSQLIAIGAGTPRIAPRDEFAEVKPVRRMQSLDGTYELLEFKDRYEVYEASSGALILKRQGRLPSFSPTGRFLSSRPPSEETFEVIDLAARIVIGRYVAQKLAWSHGDSFLYVMGAREGWLSIVRALHGQRNDLTQTPLTLHGFDGGQDIA